MVQNSVHLYSLQFISTIILHIVYIIGLLSNPIGVFMTGCLSWRQSHAWDVVSKIVLKITFWSDLHQYSCTNLCAQFLHKTETLIYTVNRPLVPSYDIAG